MQRPRAPADESRDDDRSIDEPTAQLQNDLRDGVDGMTAAAYVPGAMKPPAKVLDRVRKLLRLAESPNVHEAAVAAAQAQRLMAAHRIEAATLQVDPEDDEPIDEYEVDDRDARSGWRWELLWAVCRPNQCRPWLRWVNPGYLYTVFGTRSDADTAMYQYRLVARAIEDEVKARRRSRELQGRSACHAFRVGAVQVVRNRLAEANRHAAEQAAAKGRQNEVKAALRRIDAAGEAVERHMSEQGRGYSRGRGRRTLSDWQAFGEGRAWGERVSLGGARVAVKPGRRALGKG